MLLLFLSQMGMAWTVLDILSCNFQQLFNECIRVPMETSRVLKRRCQILYTPATVRGACRDCQAELSAKITIFGGGGFSDKVKLTLERKQQRDEV